MSFLILIRSYHKVLLSKQTINFFGKLANLSLTNTMAHTLSCHLQFCTIYELGRYSTFQYLDQDECQYPYPEDLNADTLFHVPVSVKRSCLFLPCLNSAYTISLSFTGIFSTFYPKCGDK